MKKTNPSFGSSDREPNRDIAPVSRRRVLGAAAGGALTVMGGASAAPSTSRPASAPALDEESLPTAPLGRTGAKLTRMMFGASFPDYGRRLLTFGYRNGVRVFDNSHHYLNGNAEIRLGEFVERTGKRDELFIATKIGIHDESKFYDYVAPALERLRIDTIDLLMLHGIKDPRIAEDRSGAWRRLKDRLVREKKIRFMGFSTHADMPQRIGCVANAAKSGWVDAILLACDPGLIRSNDEFNRAIDACAEAKVGLIAMKAARGLGKALEQPERAVEKFKSLGLTPHEAMFAGIWSDERFASVCTEMPNRSIIESTCRAARAFTKPFTPEQWRVIDDGIRSLARATCPGCDGSCRQAAGTKTDFASIARYLAYFEEDGKREEARRLLAALPEDAREWRGGDLEAASRACRGRLDFPSILSRVERKLMADPHHA